jgi:hypothetical protein
VFSGAAAASSVNKRRLQQLQLLLLLRALLAGHGGEGKGAEGDKELVAAGLSHAATSSFLTVAKDWSSIFYGQDHGVLQRRTDAGGHRRLASAPYGRKATLLSFSFPETKQSEGKAFSSNHDAGSSGSSPASTSLLWWSDASTTFSGGAEQEGPDCFFYNLSRILYVKFQSSPRNPLFCRGFSANCTICLGNISSI